MMKETKFIVRCCSCGELIEIDSNTIGESGWIEIKVAEDNKISINCVMCDGKIEFKGEDNNE